MLRAANIAWVSDITLQIERARLTTKLQPSNLPEASASRWKRSPPRLLRDCPASSRLRGVGYLAPAFERNVVRTPRVAAVRIRLAPHGSYKGSWEGAKTGP